VEVHERAGCIPAANGHALPSLILAEFDSILLQVNSALCQAGAWWQQVRYSQQARGLRHLSGIVCIPAAIVHALQPVGTEQLQVHIVKTCLWAVSGHSGRDCNMWLGDSIHVMH
jgi:hypothetical protein